MKVFTYGTLKQGYWNHKRLLSEATFLGETSTVDSFYLINVGFPIALLGETLPKDSKHLAYPVVGEVYEITPDILKNLDRLENYPRLYDRKEVLLLNGMTALMYFMCTKDKKFEAVSHESSCNLEEKKWVWYG